MRMSITAWLIPVAVVAMIGSVFAQGDSSEFDRPAPQPGMMPPMGEHRGGPGRGFERLRMMKLIEFLDLKDNQRQPFMEAFRDMRRRQREIEQQRMQIIEDMAQILKSDRVDERALVIKTDELQALARERFAGMDEFTKKTRSILTSVQVAKLAIFQERFEAMAMRMAREFRHHPGGPGGPEGQDMPMPPDSDRDRP